MIKVEINQSDFARLKTALARLQTTVKVRGMDTLQFNCATDYYQLVTEKIMRLRAPSPGYSKRYRNWKYEYKWEGYPSPWRLRGDLVRSLGSYRYGEGYLGGVHPGAMDSGGKSWHGKGKKGPKGESKSIEMYGRVGENKRPVFEPVMEEYKKAGWQKRIDAFMKRMEADWR